MAVLSVLTCFDIIRTSCCTLPVQRGWARYAKSSTWYVEAYMVLGLNTVCDVYFAGSIDLLCDAWNLTPDVAGATCLRLIPLERKGWNGLKWEMCVALCSHVQPKEFREDKKRCIQTSDVWIHLRLFEATWMAAGGSAPEFFTSIIGATIAPWHSLERSVVQVSSIQALLHGAWQCFLEML